MLAFNARRLVWFVIPPINSTMEFISSIYWFRFSSFSVTSVPLSTEASTSDARCSISCLPSANAFRVSVMLFPISSTAVATSSTLSWIACVCSNWFCTCSAVSVAPADTSCIASVVVLDAAVSFSKRTLISAILPESCWSSSSFLSRRFSASAFACATSVNLFLVFSRITFVVKTEYAPTMIITTICTTAASIPWYPKPPFVAPITTTMIHSNMAPVLIRRR